MERVTISSSLRHKDIIRTTISNCEELGVDAVFPNLESEIKKEDVDLEMMKFLEKAHFDAIDSSEALYVICPGGRVGTLVSVEIGYTQAQKKPVYFSEKPQDLGLQALATEYISLTHLAKLKDL